MNNQNLDPFIEILEEVLKVSRESNLSNIQLFHLLELILKLKCQVNCNQPPTPLPPGTQTARIRPCEHTPNTVMLPHFGRRSNEEETGSDRDVTVNYEGKTVTLTFEELLFTRIRYWRGGFDLPAPLFLSTIERVRSAVRRARVQDYRIEVEAFTRNKPAWLR